MEGKSSVNSDALNCLICAAWFPFYKGKYWRFCCEYQESIQDMLFQLKVLGMDLDLIPYKNIKLLGLPQMSRLWWRFVVTHEGR